MPLTGMICHHGLGLAIINLPTKLEVSISIHYRDTKTSTKLFYVQHSHQQNACRCTGWYLHQYY